MSRSRNIWITSDTHFNHEKIISWTTKDRKSVRPFSSVEEMDETLIENWNKNVKQGDIIYHLGDVVFGQKEEWLSKNMPRLNGKKRLVFGNHDDPKHFVGKGHFSKCSLWRVFSEFNIILTHVPVHEMTVKEDRAKSGRPMLNVHGHIHANEAYSKYHHCVCVEQTNFAPVNIEDLELIARGL